MREIRTSSSEGGGAEINRPSLPLSTKTGDHVKAGLPTRPRRFGEPQQRGFYFHACACATSPSVTA